MHCLGWSFTDPCVCWRGGRCGILRIFSGMMNWTRMDWKFRLLILSQYFSDVLIIFFWITGWSDWNFVQFRQRLEAQLFGQIFFIAFTGQENPQGFPCEVYITSKSSEYSMTCRNIHINPHIKNLTPVANILNQNHFCDVIGVLRGGVVIPQIFPR